MQIFNNTYISYVIVWIMLNIIKYHPYFTGWDIYVTDHTIHILKDHVYYNYYLMFYTMCNIIEIMYYINIIYLYFGILSKIFNDIDTIVDIHLFYGLILFCNLYNILPFDFSLQMILGLFGCLYIRNIYIKLLNLE
jgi:hypothetical protein